MKDIKLVAWDVYGTIISSYVDNLNRRILRPDVLDLIQLINSCKIPQVTSSDGKIEKILQSFSDLGVKPEYFDKMYKMVPGQEKDYAQILTDYNVKPENLLVVGNNYKVDIKPAKELGCQTLFTPEDSPRKKFPVLPTLMLHARCRYQALNFS